MSQAEHGPTSPAWLVTTCPKLAKEVNALVRIPPSSLFELSPMWQRNSTLLLVACSVHPWAISFFSTRYDIDMILGFFLDTIRYRYDIRASKKTFFLRNFRQIFGIFGVVVVVVVEDFGSWVFGIFGEFSEFSEFSENFRRKKTKKSLVLRISRYSIWEVRYDILFDIRKSPIYRHSINFRYDKLITEPDTIPRFPVGGFQVCIQ